MTPIRTRGDLVRTVEDEHAIVTEVNRRTNTATIITAAVFLRENVSWWDLKAGDDVTDAVFTAHPARWHNPVEARVVPRPVLVS